MKDLYEVIQNSHDAEFIYNDTTYVIQTELNGGEAFLVIWDCTPEAPRCIAKHKIPDQNIISDNIIDTILTDKCFAGKSFKDIEKDVKVTVIY